MNITKDEICEYNSKDMAGNDISSLRNSFKLQDNFYAPASIDRGI